MVRFLVGFLLINASVTFKVIDEKVADFS